MKLEEKNYTYRNLNMRFPGMVEEAIDIYEDGHGNLILEMPDDTRWLFQAIGSMIRRLPKDKNNVTEEECLSEFGIRLVAIMNRDGVSQQELCERTGIPQAAMSRYINGINCPSFYKVDKIARALGCSVDELRYL